MVLYPSRNPRRLRRGDQRSLKQPKSEIESSKYKISFIKNISSGSTQDILVLDKYGYGTFRSGYHGVLWGITIA